MSNKELALDREILLKLVRYFIEVDELNLSNGVCEDCLLDAGLTYEEVTRVLTLLREDL